MTLDQYRNPACAEYVGNILQHVGQSKNTWLSDSRKKAVKNLSQVGFPTQHHEGWKYLDITPIFNVNRQDGASLFEQGGVVEAATARMNAYAVSNYVLINGVWGNKLGKPVVSGTQSYHLSGQTKMSEDLRAYLADSVAQEANPVAMANGMQFEDGLCLQFEKKAVVDECTVNVIAYAKDGAAEIFSRILIVAEEDSQAKVVIRHLGAGYGSYLDNCVIDVILKERASLDLVLMQDDTASGTLLSQVNVHQAKDSNLQWKSFIVNGALSRSQMNINLDGEGAVFDFKGVCTFGQTERHYQHITVDHFHPLGTSQQVFKSVLGNQAKTEFNSIVYVHRNAQKSQSHQLNRNLMLSDEAQAYSRPQLKIYADDVQCNHGATTGQIDDKELFYLQSRGFSKNEARHVLIYGFVKEIIQTVPDVEVAKEIETVVSDKLTKLLS